MSQDIAMLQQVVSQQLSSGQVVVAEKTCRRIVELDPGNAQGWFTLGTLAENDGRLEQATECFERAAFHAPGHGPAHVRLGNLLWIRGKADAALASFKTALTLAPGSPDIEFRMANALIGLRRQKEALDIYRNMEARGFESSGLLNNMSVALMELGRCEEAIDCCLRAIQISPRNHEAHNNLGNALRFQQRFDEAIGSFRNALKCRPNFAHAHSNLLLTMNYVDIPQSEIFAESCRFGEQQVSGHIPEVTEFANLASPERVIKIGFVSPDFHSHPVASFFLPVLTEFDRSKFDVYCYSNTIQTDDTSARIEARSDHWCSVVGWNDDDIANRVRQDGIDILVDLAGHTGSNKLLVFARRPAPLQVSWLGYPNTTGLTAIDYRLTDAVADPIGRADKLHTEKLVRLEHGFLCYRCESSTPDVSPPPSIETGRVTFGSFNNLVKIRPPVVNAWAKIMHAVPDSQLVLKASALSDRTTRDLFLGMFAAEGIAAERLELLGWMPSPEEHMAAYARIDIGLETFPFNGTTTTCDALWMGVPVVTLSGNRHASRVGASILHRVGLDDLVADSEQGMVDLAIELAADTSRRVSLRAGLRERMLSSPLTDAGAITRSIEAALREMWRTWCAEREVG